MLLRCDDLSAAEPHDVEAFGPVSTVLPYDGVGARASSWRRAARAAWSARSSPTTRPWPASSCSAPPTTHGRILVLDRDDAKENTGHGSPLPVLVHGGPGRAGGGEELGGIRGVLHHMQRTAVQGSPDMLTAIGGRWVTGARRTRRRRPPVPQVAGRAADRRLGDRRAARR